MNLQTVRTASAALGVPETVIRRAVNEKKIKTLRLGNRLLVDLDAARELVKQHNNTITIEEVSKQTGLSITAIRRGVREGWIPCERPGWAFRFDIEAVKAAIRQRMTGEETKD